MESAPLQTSRGPAFSVAEYQERQWRAKEVLHQFDCVAAICVAPETIFYLSGHEAHTHFSEQALVLLRDAPPFLLLRDTDLEVCRETSWFDDIVTYRYGVDDPVDLIKVRLSEAGVRSGNIGLDQRSNFLTMAFGNRVVEKLAPSMRIRDVTRAIAALRLVKSDSEIRYIREAAAISRKGFDAAMSSLRPGMTELELASEISYAMSHAGSEYPAMPLWMATGARTICAHAHPSTLRINYNEVVRFGFAAVRRRYHVTNYQTIFLGTPDALFERRYADAKFAQEALMAAVRAGNPVREAARAGAEALRSRGPDYPMTMRWGYGVGIGFPPIWLEPLDITETSDDVFEVGMMFCLHVCLFFPAESYGFHVGGDYLLTREGLEALSTVGLDLPIVH